MIHKNAVKYKHTEEGPPSVRGVLKVVEILEHTPYQITDPQYNPFS